MDNVQKPRPFMEYQTRVGGVLHEDGKYRGVIGCEYRDPSLTKPEYFDFKCEALRMTKEEASSDAATLFYLLETTSPPTVAFSGHVYSLPTLEEQARAQNWLRENDHVALYFEREFPGARLANTAPLGSSAIRG